MFKYGIGSDDFHCFIYIGEMFNGFSCSHHFDSEKSRYLTNESQRYFRLQENDCFIRLTKAAKVIQKYVKIFLKNLEIRNRKQIIEMKFYSQKAKTIQI